MTLNVFKLLHAAMGLRPGRSTIVAHRGEFPTDRYVAAEVARQRGGGVRWLGPLAPDAEAPVDPVTAYDVAGALNDDVAVVLLSVVDYRSAAVAEVASITRAAHDVGALVIWDCSHAAGPCRCSSTPSGPTSRWGARTSTSTAAPVRPPGSGPRHGTTTRCRTRCRAGWATPTCSRWAPTTSPRPGYAGSSPGRPRPSRSPRSTSASGLLAEAGMDAVRAKSERSPRTRVGPRRRLAHRFGVTLASPRDPAVRGSHVTVRHPDALALTQALTDRGVIPDFRHPDGVRIGLAPLTTRFTDVHDGLALAARPAAALADRRTRGYRIPDGVPPAG